MKIKRKAIIKDILLLAFVIIILSIFTYVLTGKNHKTGNIKASEYTPNTFSIRPENAIKNNSYNHLQEIPLPKHTNLKETSPSEIAINKDDCIEYIVNRGDTLFDICRKYQVFCPVGTALKTVIALNKLNDANNLNIGSTIELPDKFFTSGIKYTVKEGDTLFSIAKKHLPSGDIKAAINMIMKDNFMKNEEVHVGDELFIENGE